MKDTLTLDMLKEMAPGTIFAEGEIENSPEGLFMTNSDIGRKLLWVAKRGGFHDWAIYTHWKDSGRSHVLSNGDKVTSEDNIKKLVPCTEEALKMYRS